MTQATPEQLSARPSEAPGPEEALAQRQDRGELARLVAALPPRQREVVRLKFEHGLSYREIAEVLGCSVGNVGYQVHAAVNSLRRKLAVAIPAAAAEGSAR